MSKQKLKAPFPWFGGKSRVAALVWDRLGDCDNVVEPFFGSGAFLLARPHPPRIETVNDLDCYVANFWRATQHDPEAVAAHADSPVNEADLHARHRWLVLSDDAAAFRRRMRQEPDYFDPKVAGWWCWGLCCWIGSGWCTEPGLNWEGRVSAFAGDGEFGTGQGVNKAKGQDRRKPRIDGGEGQLGHGVHARGEPLSKLRIDGDNPGSVGKGVNAGGRVKGLHERRPCIGGGSEGNTTGNARGVLSGPRDGNRPQLADAFDIGRGVNSHGDLGTCAARRAWLVEWFGRLRDRLRLVRVCCGDWLRVCDSESVTTRLGTTGIFFDPPYGEKAGRNDKLYATDSLTVAADVRRYCLERGGDPRMRIALAGYDGEGHEDLEAHGWTVEGWSAQGGYGNRSARGKANARKERLWFSPHCLNGRTLFDAP